jgi:hypothetical protein
MEKVYDLLSKTRNEEVDIREDPKSGIRINGLNETIVSTWEETLKCLENGSLNRRTGATAMNHQSSRSHAIFTLTINQVCVTEVLFFRIYLMFILFSRSTKRAYQRLKRPSSIWLISLVLNGLAKHMLLGKDLQRE